MKQDDILVASWGYSMILTTWVKVVKESPKTLLVQEIEHRSLSQEELDATGLTLGFMQSYQLPVLEQVRLRNGQPSKTFRIYKREKENTYPSMDSEVVPENVYYIGKPDGFSSSLRFKIWDGGPMLEDHAD